MNQPTDDAQLLAMVYDRLRGMAEKQLAGERHGHTLQPTALVHEVWVQLRDHLAGLRDEPARFYGAAAESMRRVLIDHARRRGAQKRGGGKRAMPLDLVELAATAGLDEVLELDAAITALAEQSPRSAEVVRLRFYTGLSEAEAATVMGTSERTVRREWAYARAFLFQKLQGPENP
ncbi:MAG: sigma-70 family RNA polymerase sigma factor [Phycisphaerales bacterium]|nr:sigma-70 family RNA polymerase sigma factor [Phycisphaerales bacterium]